MIQVSVEKAVQDLRREFRDLTNDEFQIGVARSINHTLAKVKTASNREIRTIYNIQAKHVNKALTIRKANKAQQYGFVIASGLPIPLSAFKPSQNATGVSVMIKKGNRQQINSAFIGSMSSGHTGVFARGAYESRDFRFRHKRLMPSGGYRQVGERYQPVNNDLSINELSTLSIPKAFSNQTILRNLTTKIQEDFPTRLVHELSRLR